MLTTFLAAAYALFIWWFSTGLILFLDKQPRGRHVWYMVIASLVTVGAVYGLWATKDRETVSAMVCAFTAGLTLWGWHEMAFLMGYITGPRRTACPPNISEGRRFGFALQTILYHEMALLATVAALAILLDNHSNQFALWTFSILWIARLSAKLNVFLGVRNLAESFLPDHLRYLASYFRKSRGNPLFPITTTLVSVMTGVLAYAAITSPTVGGHVGFTLLTALTSLAVIEHWMLVLPISESALWKWAMPRDEESQSNQGLKAENLRQNGQEFVDASPEYFRLSSYSPTLKDRGDDAGERPETQFEGRIIPGTSD